jgi:Ras-related protein Rab-1A
MGCNNSKEYPHHNQSDINVSNSSQTGNSTSTATAKKNNVYKILMIGDASVGKTSLSARWVDNSFADNYIATIGVDFKVKTINGERIQVWDTAGQERYSTITSTYYRGCHGIIIVYDITSMSSFNNVKKWLTDIKNYAPDEDQLSILILGNKSDQEAKRQVTKEDIATQLGEYDFMEASAMTGEGVAAAFDVIINSMKKKRGGSV